MKFLSIKEYPDVVDDATLSHLQNRNVKRAIKDIQDFLATNGGYGIALPQIGISLKIVVARLDKTSALQIMLNPTFKEDRSKGKSWQEEACFSLDQITYKNKRWNKIKASWIDEQGETVIKVLRKFPATIFLHEYDHLNFWKVKIKEIEDPKIKNYIRRMLDE